MSLNGEAAQPHSSKAAQPDDFYYSKRAAFGETRI